MRALALGLLLAAAAAGFARAAPAPSLVIQGDRVLAGVGMYAQRSRVEAKLGPADSARPDGVYECVLRWRRLGLTMRLVDLSGAQPCRGFYVAATATGSVWRTASGLRIGSTVAELRRLHPAARLHAAAGADRGWWLVTRRACSEIGGFAYPGLLARTIGGRVSALVVAGAICE